MKTFKELKTELLTDPEIRREYNNLEPKYMLIKQIILRRQKKGLTQKELALRIGTRQSAVARFESGLYNPSLTFLRKIAYALETELHITLQ